MESLSLRVCIHPLPPFFSLSPPSAFPYKDQGGAERGKGRKVEEERKKVTSCVFLHRRRLARRMDIRYDTAAADGGDGEHGKKKLASAHIFSLLLPQYRIVPQWRGVLARDEKSGVLRQVVGGRGEEGKLVIGVRRGISSLVVRWRVRSRT